MQDKLEDFIRENRSAFDAAEPDAGHRRAFQRRLKEERLQRQRKRRLRVAAIAAAVAIPLAFFIGLTMNYNGGNDSTNGTLAEVQEETALPDLADYSDEYGEAAQYFQREMDDKLLMVADFNSESHPAKSICMEELNTLETEYEDLRKDLLESNGDERVVTSMIRNYRTRLKILDRLLLQLEAMNQQNTENETTRI